MPVGEPLDPWVLGTAALALLAVAFLAAHLPVRRATRVGPVQTFRSEG